MAENHASHLFERGERCVVEKLDDGRLVVLCLSLFQVRDLKTTEAAFEVERGAGGIRGLGARDALRNQRCAERENEC